MKSEIVFLVQEMPRGDTPPMLVLIGVGLVLIALTAGALLILTRTLPSLKGLPSRVFLLTVAYNALIVGVKFVLAPLGFYQSNRKTEFESLFGLGGVIVAGAGSAFLMYLLVLWVIHRVQKRSVIASIGQDAEKRKSIRKKAVVIGAFAGIIILTGGGAMLLVYLAAGDTLQYLNFVFSSVFAVLIVIMLVGATFLAAGAFQSAGEHSVAVRNAALLATLFWVCVCLLAAYHVLWVVFVLVLNSVWPLRVVVPK